MKKLIIASTMLNAALVSASLYSARAEVADKAIPAQSAFACPSAVNGATAEQREKIRELLPSGNALQDPARLNASIDGLKRLGLSKTMIVDHLVGAYCATVARDKPLSDTAKTAEVRRFASRITPIVDNEENVSEISLNVLLRPSVVDKVNAEAQAGGLSVEKWLSKTVEAAVQQR
jgi:hypothetical protein